MNINDLFLKLKKYNIFDVEYRNNYCKNFSCTIFDDKLENYCVNNTNNCKKANSIYYEVKIVEFFDENAKKS